MKKQNLLILAAVVLLTVLPLWLVPYLGIGGDEGELFGGADDKAQQAIATVAPDYQRWFEPLLEPASGEIASLLFALQAALGGWRHRLLAGLRGNPRQAAQTGRSKGAGAAC